MNEHQDGVSFDERLFKFMAGIMDLEPNERYCQKCETKTAFCLGDKQIFKCPNCGLI